MSGSASQGQSRGELETARALNTVATIGAGHALWTSLPERTRAKTGRLVPKAVKAPVQRARAKVRVPKGAGRKAALATTAGWLGFHGAELAGDIMARRSINMQLDAKKEKAVAKSIEQSFMSLGESGPVTGIGVNIEKRYFDAEADRQRRLGMAAGVLGGTSIAAGAAAAKGVKPYYGLSENGSKMGAGLVMELKNGQRPRKVVRGKAGLAALAAATGSGSLWAYKRGVSRRNQTWQ